MPVTETPETISPFHALHFAHNLCSYTRGADKLIPAYAASDIEIYPYQVSAALFALRSHYNKGIILCDDGSLGKTYETLLILTQAWYEGKRAMLIVVPAPLLEQWQNIIDERFSMPCITLTEYITEKQDAMVLATYDEVYNHADVVAQTQWDYAVFEEAHHLRHGNTRTIKIKEVVSGSFKILLTATPMQNSIMDLYGLIHFIDENALVDEKSFYNRYFRKPENYSELADGISRYCCRTMRSDVATYLKLPKRIPITHEYALTPNEQWLYDLLNEYLQRPNKPAFPKMEQYDLTLLLLRPFSSSTYAIAKTLQGICDRLEKQSVDDYVNGELDDEYGVIHRMLTLSNYIDENAKGTALLSALDKCFIQLRNVGAQQKALIFTEYKETQRYLNDLLTPMYKVLTYDGDYSVIEQFEHDAQILIATDIASEGFNLQFCSLVVNYDLPYNTLKAEQRINRCHRQGQLHDVIVLNFINRNNFADVRMLELINKRVLQFDGIIGLSDDILGNFTDDVTNVLSTLRTTDEIEQSHNEVLFDNEQYNKLLVEFTERKLFTYFNSDLTDDIRLSPQYIEQKVTELNDNLWRLIECFFRNKRGYTITEETRSLYVSGIAQKAFTGTRLGRYEYSMLDKSMPKSGRITITSSIAQNVVNEIQWIGVPDNGDVVVDGDIEPCTIAYYEVTTKAEKVFMSARTYHTFVGRAGTRILSHDECVRIMSMPIISFTTQGERVGGRNRHLVRKRKHELDQYVDTAPFIEKSTLALSDTYADEAEHLRFDIADRKLQLERDLNTLRDEIAQLTNSGLQSQSLTDKIKVDKDRNTKLKQLRQREQSLFMDKLRLDQEYENALKAAMQEQKVTAEIYRLFCIRITGGNNG